MKQITTVLAAIAFLVVGNTSAFARNSALFLTQSARQDLAAQVAAPGVILPANPAGSKVVYYGGPVIANVKLYTVFWSSKVSASIQAATPDFYKTLVTSSYLDWLKQYNTTGVSVMNGHTGTNQSITRGTYASTITINPAVQSGTITDEAIQAEITRQIDAGVLPAPTDNTLFMIHFPKGMTETIDDGSGGRASSCQQFCAYHEGFKTQKGQAVFYGVIPDLDSAACAFGCGGGSSLSRMTISASHEVTEAITDGFPTPGSSPDYPQAWNTTDGQEVSDLCQGANGTLTGGKVKYTVTQSWNNTTNACSTGNYSK